MLTVLLGTATAVLFGTSDFTGGMASRRDSATAVTATAHVLGVAVLLSAALLFPFERVIAGDLGFGAVAGISGGLGVFSLYAALAVGRMSIVAPITAALSGSLPALHDFATGGTISPLAGVGLVLALGATVLVSMTAHPDDPRGMPPRAVALSVAAGCGFAGSFVALSLTAPESGLWPLVAARVVSATMMSAFAFMRVRRILVTRGIRRLTLGTGALDSLANITMISAIRIGPLAVASVLGSLYPVVTVLLAFGILHEKVTVLQRVGIVVALLAVVMTGVA